MLPRNENSPDPLIPFPELMWARRCFLNFVLWCGAKLFTNDTFCVCVSMFFFFYIYNRDIYIIFFFFFPSVCVCVFGFLSMRLLLVHRRPYRQRFECERPVCNVKTTAIACEWYRHRHSPGTLDGQSLLSRNQYHLSAS